METKTLRLNALNSNPQAPSESSNTSSSPTNTRLTPNSDDDDESDLELQQAADSYRLQSRREHVIDEKATLKDGGDGSDGGEGYEDYDAPSRRRASMSTVQSYQLYTPDEERAVVRKFDRKLVLFVAVLYMLSFLDRSNIGNAFIAGLAEEFRMTSNQVEWVLSSFYISYIAFEWLTFLWKIVPAHIFLSGLVLSWGTVASLQSITTSYPILIVLRVLLGIGEAGFTGIPFYLSFFYKREELAFRTGLFISAAPLATSFASSLASGIVLLANYTPISAWRLLFLIEGFPSVIVAVIAYNTIPDSPSTARYLTRREKKIASLRLRKENHPSKPQIGGLERNEILATLTEPKAYITAFMFFFANMAFSSMPVFLPTIVYEMGHSVLISQALCAPPFLLAFFVVITTAYLSDRLQSRGYIIIFHALLSCLGYTIMAISGHLNLSPWYRYAGVYPACVGFFSVITIIITWNINNQESESKQGMGFAMMQIIGQCGPIVGTRLYPDSDAPLYVGGSVGCALAMGVVALLAGGLRWYLGRLNKRKERECEEIGKEEEQGFVRGGKRREVVFRYLL